MDEGALHHPQSSLVCYLPSHCFTLFWSFLLGEQAKMGVMAYQPTLLPWTAVKKLQGGCYCLCNPVSKTAGMPSLFLLSHLLLLLNRLGGEAARRRSVGVQEVRRRRSCICSKEKKGECCIQHCFRCQLSWGRGVNPNHLSKSADAVTLKVDL